MKNSTDFCFVPSGNIVSGTRAERAARMMPLVATIVWLYALLTVQVGNVVVVIVGAALMVRL